MCLLNDYTHLGFPLQHKSQVFPLSKFRNYVHTQFEKEIKAFQCDNGREFDIVPFHGMTFRFSCPYTSSQNGKAEHPIHTLKNMFRTLLIHANLPVSFLVHALDMATYLLHILPTQTLHIILLLKLFSTKSLPMTIFESLLLMLSQSYLICSSQTRPSRSIPCVFLGFSASHRGYKCYDLSSNTIIISRHVYTLILVPQTPTLTVFYTPNLEMFGVH